MLQKKSFLTQNVGAGLPIWHGHHNQSERPRWRGGPSNRREDVPVLVHHITLAEPHCRSSSSVWLWVRPATLEALCQVLDFSLRRLLTPTMLRYFQGDIKAASYENHGTDIYIYVQALAKESVSWHHRSCKMQIKCDACVMYMLGWL